MFNQYLNDFEKALKKLHYSNTEYAKNYLKRKIKKLEKQNLTEQSILQTLGSPEMQARKFVEENCPKTKGQVVMNDVFFFGFSCLLIAAGTIAMAFVSALCGICGAIYLVKPFIDQIFVTGGQKAGAFFLALCGLAMCTLGIYLTVVIVKKAIAAIKKHLATRQENLERIVK